MELAIQKYLRSGKMPENLTTEYNIKCTRHGEYPNLILFKYWIDTPMSEQISQECRGIILDEDKNWEVVSFPYVKFWNSFEGLAAKIDWSTAKVMEKLDGSLCIVYSYNGKWHVSSSGKPDASGGVNNSGITFANLFWDTWQMLDYKLPIDTNFCYMFELLTPQNRIVCVYDRPRIVLHGARNTKTLCEQFPESIAKDYGWECIKSYPLQTFDEVVACAKELNPLANEGFVVADHSFNRIKIKSPQYVAIAHLKDGLGIKNLLNLVRTGEAPEFLSYFPEFTAQYSSIAEKYESLVQEISETFAKYEQIDSQKGFAIQVKNLPYAGVLFQLRKNREMSVKDLLKDLRIEKLVELIDHQKSLALP